MLKIAGLTTLLIISHSWSLFVTVPFLVRLFNYPPCCRSTCFSPLKCLFARLNVSAGLSSPYVYAKTVEFTWHDEAPSLYVWNSRPSFIEGCKFSGILFPSLEQMCTAACPYALQVYVGSFWGACGERLRMQQYQSHAFWSALYKCT